MKSCRLQIKPNWSNCEKSRKISACFLKVFYSRWESDCKWCQKFPSIYHLMLFTLKFRKSFSKFDDDIATQKFYCCFIDFVRNPIDFSCSAFALTQSEAFVEFTLKFNLRHHSFTAPWNNALRKFFICLAMSFGAVTRNSTFVPKTTFFASSRAPNKQHRIWNSRHCRNFFVLSKYSCVRGCFVCST